MRRSTTLRAYVVIVVLAVLGLASAAYILSQQGQGAPNPWRDVYEVNAELAAADAVAPGVGQPVNVAGVEVGSITGARHSGDGNARVTLEIERKQLPRVYANAKATLEPITPLEDMQIELDPGVPPAPALRSGATIGIERTSTPVALADVLDSLDGDTRAYLTSLLASLDHGTADQGKNLRRMLRALGPTTGDLRKVTQALAGRRRALARLVHNLALVTRAASRDRELADIIRAGNRTLSALARQDAPLRQAIARLPGTLQSTRAVLSHAAVFSRKLRPALAALEPPVRDLPATFAALRPFASTTTRALSRHVRPLVTEAQPLVRDLGVATPRLTALAPNMTSTLQVLNYAVNELAYNAPGGDEGALFWFPWWAHNWNNALGFGDAHGALGRLTVVSGCEHGETVGREIEHFVKALFSIPATCPRP